MSDCVVLPSAAFGIRSLDGGTQRSGEWLEDFKMQWWGSGGDCLAGRKRQFFGDVNYETG